MHVKKVKTITLEQIVKNVVDQKIMLQLRFSLLGF